MIVSNHGGRQLESNRATIDYLPGIVDEIQGKFPVLIDGGIRRGTDIFKALEILKAEFVRAGQHLSKQLQDKFVLPGYGEICLK